MAEKKTKRLHLLIEPSVLDAINEYRFKEKCGTQAEAIRRLIEIGLKAEALGDMWSEPWEFMGVV